MNDITNNPWLLKPEKVWRPVFAGRVAAEFGMLLAAAGVVPLVKAVAPERYDRLKQHLANIVVKPNAEWLEKHIFQSPAFAMVGSKLRGVENPDERAKIMSDAIVDFSALMISGVAGQLVTQMAADRFAGLPNLVRPETKGYLSRHLEHTRNVLKPVVFDKVLNMGMVAAMQVGMPQTTTAVTDITADVLQKSLNVPPEATQYFLQWQLPNLVGLAGSGVMLSRKYSDFLSKMGPLHAK